jgi:hypothetical protein
MNYELFKFPAIMQDYAPSVRRALPDAMDKHAFSAVFFLD